MPLSMRNIRSLQDIQTLSGKVDQVFRPYKAYMRITCLEMEKARRGKEREGAMHRVKNIDARLREIEAEKAALLQTMDERSAGDAIDAPGDEPKPAPRRSTGRLKIRY